MNMSLKRLFFLFGLVVIATGFGPCRQGTDYGNPPTQNTAQTEVVIVNDNGVGSDSNHQEVSFWACASSISLVFDGAERVTYSIDPSVFEIIPGVQRVTLGSFSFPNSRQITEVVFLMKNECPRLPGAVRVVNPSGEFISSEPVRFYYEGSINTDALNGSRERRVVLGLFSLNILDFLANVQNSDEIHNIPHGVFGPITVQ